jgi:hypothetical protein
MTLAKHFLPLLCSAIRLYAGTWHVWRKPQCPIHGQPLAVRRDFSPSRSRERMAGPRMPDGMVWILALVGCLFGILALSLAHAASPAAGEVMGPLSTIVSGSGASPVLSRVEARPLTTMTFFASPSDESFTLDDNDLDDDDSSAMPLRILRGHFLPPTPVCVCFTGSTHTCLWPTHYFMRPQLLTRI